MQLCFGWSRWLDLLETLYVYTRKLNDRRQLDNDIFDSIEQQLRRLEQLVSQHRMTANNFRLGKTRTRALVILPPRRSQCASRARHLCSTDNAEPRKVNSISPALWFSLRFCLVIWTVANLG